MSTPRIYRTSPRLRTFDYLGTHVYNMGLVTRERKPLLLSHDTAAQCLTALQASSNKYGFQPLAYCFMPDHVHLLVSSDDGASAQRFMRHFKQLSGYAYKQVTGDYLWQTSYYDHVLRSEEAIRPIAEYIWMNPVRKGLVDQPMQWPHSGPREHMTE